MNVKANADLLLQTLPRGRNAAPREVVRESQRVRLIAAMAAVVAEKGYAKVAVADVIERAGVSRKSFYEHFADKEACFLAAYDAAVDLVIGAIDEVVEPVAGDLVTAAIQGTERYLELLAQNPDLARTFQIEVLGAGPEAIRRRIVVHERFAERFAATHAAVRAQYPEVPDVPEHVFRACVGAINELVTDHLLRHGAETLPGLLPQILDVQMALLAGHETAERLLAGRVGGGPAAARG